MRVLFIYSDYAVAHYKRINYGVAYLSSVLKQDGVTTGLIHIYFPPEKESFLNNIKRFNPDIIAYSSISNQHPMIRRLASWSKELGIFTIYGGIHPTIAPQESVETEGIDAICIGEGDEAIREFAMTFQQGGDIGNVRNFWVKTKSGIRTAPIRPLIVDLDALPIPDYELFPYDQLTDYLVDKSLFLLAGRGCPYSCSYCANNYLRGLYPNKEQYLRQRSVGKLIAEITYVRKLYPKINNIFFTGDTLASRLDWFREFCERYPREINLPYGTNEHPHNVTPSTIELYRKSGCVQLNMGIENGNDDFRMHVMKRPVQRDKIIQAFLLAHSTGIKVAAFNILGFPGETLSTIMDTAKLNALCKPDFYINAYFEPYKNTEAYELCKKAGAKIKELPSVQFEGASVELPTVSHDELVWAYKYFSLITFLYKILFTVLRNSNHSMVKWLDRLLTWRFIPHRCLHLVKVTRTDLKKRYPMLGQFVFSLKQKVRSLSSGSHIKFTHFAGEKYL